MAGRREEFCLIEIGGTSIGPPQRLSVVDVNPSGHVDESREAEPMRTNPTPQWAQSKIGPVVARGRYSTFLTQEMPWNSRAGCRSTRSSRSAGSRPPLLPLPRLGGVSITSAALLMWIGSGGRRVLCGVTLDTQHVSSFVRAGRTAQQAPRDGPSLSARVGNPESKRHRRTGAGRGLAHWGRSLFGGERSNRSRSRWRNRLFRGRRWRFAWR